MDQPRPDLSLQLPVEIYWQVIHTLQTNLPPPVDASPEAQAIRDRTAMAVVASLIPANADEANLAALYVGASAQANDCLRTLRAHAGDPKRTQQLLAQAANMMRQARGFRALLLRVQATRQKREAVPAARSSDALTEHCVLGLMHEALTQPDLLPAAMRADAADPGQAGPAPDDPPVRPIDCPEPLAAPLPAPQPTVAEPEEPQPDPATEAETYAVIYPGRARLIRRLGGLPAHCDFGPPEPELVQAIVTGTSPALRALDDHALAA